MKQLTLPLAFAGLMLAASVADATFLWRDLAPPKPKMIELTVAPAQTCVTCKYTAVDAYLWRD
jgi:hypothetical protein